MLNQMGYNLYELTKNIALSPEIVIFAATSAQATWECSAILLCINRSVQWWCNAVKVIFLAHFGPFSTNWALSLSQDCCCPYPSLCDHSAPILWVHWRFECCGSYHLKMVSWTWQWVQIASTFTKSQSSSAPLGCGGTKDLNHGYAIDKTIANVWWSCQCWLKTLNECLQHLAESMPQRIKPVLKSKGCSQPVLEYLPTLISHSKSSVTWPCLPTFWHMIKW